MLLADTNHCEIKFEKDPNRTDLRHENKGKQ